MAHKIEILRGATTYVLNDPSDPSNPFSLEDGAGLGGASVRNIEESGPYQDGSTHLDERLEPGVSTWRIFVKGATAAALDGHRDTLNKMFKPIRGVPIIVKYTRDDGAIRYQDTHRTGSLDIPLTKENRPGNLHKAVVQLRAADPTWYDPDEQEEDFLTPTSWWLAFNTIGTADVLEHATSPGTAQLWINSGSAVGGSPWTIFFRSGIVTPTATLQSAFGAVANIGAAGAIAFDAQTFYAGGYGANTGPSVAEGTLMASGTHDYYMITTGANAILYRGDTLAGSASAGPSDPIPGTASGTARWRSRSDGQFTWPTALPFAAAYKIALSASQRTHLSLAIVTGGSAYSVPLAYEGDVDSYPIITIAGPFANPIITNSTTGDALDFTGGTVGSGDIWTIDTRYGRKSILNTAGSSVERYLSLDSDLATFRLVADPIATGGINLITMGGSAQGAAAGATLTWFNRYLSY